MRAKAVQKKVLKPKCVVCKGGLCIDEYKSKDTYKINPGYTGRVTRSITKVLDHMKDFIVVETYRCMPLLGDEEKVPNWEIHIVRYEIIFK